MIRFDGYTTVYEAEIMAIIGAIASLLDQLPERRIHIFIGCMSAIRALANAAPSTGLTRD